MPSSLLVDLYNTLLPGGDSGRDAMARSMAVDLGIDPDAFARQVIKSWPERMTGAYGDLSAETAALAGQLGVSPSPAALATAVERRFAFARSQVVPPQSSIDTMTALRAAGWRIAIVSNCTFDSAQAIRRTALADASDALVLSCELHAGKPDPAIYLAACAALGNVDPTDCLYVGDGADHELSGAAALGMRVIQTTEFAHTAPSWSGPQIASISDLVGLVGCAR